MPLFTLITKILSKFWRELYIFNVVDNVIVDVIIIVDVIKWKKKK